MHGKPCHHLISINSRLLTTGPDAIPASPLGTTLLLKWGWGALSATDCQEIAHHSQFSGTDQEDLDIIASCGSYGTNPSHIHGELLNKFCGDLIPPAPHTVVLPIKDPKGDPRAVDYTDVAIFLPSFWMRALYEKAVDQFVQTFGTHALSDFWDGQDLNHPRYEWLRRQRNVRQRCIPIVVHGDGVSFQDRDSLLVTSFSGLLKDKTTTLDSNLLISAFPKSCSIPATQARLWRWIVWDLRALVTNFFDTKDPWGEQLPDGFPSGPVLPHDWFAWLFGMEGDNDYFQNELGLPHSANMPPNPACHMCNCMKDISSRNWFNFAASAPWRSDRPRFPASSHEINDVEGMNGYGFLLDWLHIMDLGISSHCCGNVIYDAVFRKMAGVPRERAVARVLNKIKEAESSHGKSLERLHEKDFTNPRRHLRTYPCLTHVKGAEVRHIIPGVLLVARTYSDGSDESQHQILMMESLMDMYEIIYGAGIRLDVDEYTRLQASFSSFAMHYTWLSNYSVAQGRCMYSVTAKFHYACHMINFSNCINPRYVWTYGGEDFVGRMARLGHMCLFGTPIQKLTLVMAERYRVGMHLRLTRL